VRPAKTALLVVDVQRGILDMPNLARKKEIDGFDAGEHEACVLPSAEIRMV